MAGSRPSCISSSESAIRRASPMPPVPCDFPGEPVVYFTAQLSIDSF